MRYAYIQLSFEQNIDIFETDDCCVWKKVDNCISPISETDFDVKTYITKDVAPSVVFMEINNDESFNELREKWINDVIDTISFYEGIYSNSKMILVGIEAAFSGGLITLCREVGAYIIKDKLDGIKESAIKFAIKYIYNNKYYYDELINMSGYHKPNIVRIVPNVDTEIGLCNYNIVISEILVKDNYDKIIPRLKKCDRWSNNIAYGVKGSCGIWE